MSGGWMGMLDTHLVLTINSMGKDILIVQLHQCTSYFNKPKLHIEN